MSRHGAVGEDGPPDPMVRRQMERAVAAIELAAGEDPPPTAEDSSRRLDQMRLVSSTPLSELRQLIWESIGCTFGRNSAVIPMFPKERSDVER